MPDHSNSVRVGDHALCIMMMLTTAV